MHDAIQCVDRGDVPEVRVRKVEQYALDVFLEVELGDQRLRRREEHLSADGVFPGRSVGLQGGRDAEHALHLGCEENRAEQYAGQDAHREVMRGDDHDDRRQHDEGRALRVHEEVLDGAPAECADRHHDHDGDERGHGDLLYPRPQEHNHDEQQHAGGARRQPPAPA
ncbi:hypothetical protein D9M68_870150 [compost metagenome]